MNGDFDDEGNINVTNRIVTNNSTTGSLGWHAFHDSASSTGYFGSSSYFSANTSYATSSTTDTSVLVDGTTATTNPFTISSWTMESGSTHYKTAHNTF